MGHEGEPEVWVRVVIGPIVLGLPESPPRLGQLPQQPIVRARDLDQTAERIAALRSLDARLGPKRRAVYEALDPVKANSTATRFMAVIIGLDRPECVIMAAGAKPSLTVTGGLAARLLALPQFISLLREVNEQFPHFF